MWEHVAFVGSMGFQGGRCERPLKRVREESSRVEMKALLKAGLSKTAVAAELGVDRRTIHRWESEDAKENPAPRRRVHKLDPYKGIVRERLKSYPKLTAQRLYEEVRAPGYDGGYGRVRDYVREIREAEPIEPVKRFETPPGRQAQVDFGTFRVPWGRRHALLVVLGHSRLRWLEFYPSQTMTTVMKGLERSFAYFGGVPSELLFDQMKAVVIDDQRESGGSLLLNRHFIRFASHWDFRIRACRPYRAQTKGKVERQIGYVRQSFHYGRTFVNDDDLNEQARGWLRDVANVRRHGVDGESPRERFEQVEKDTLGPWRRRVSYFPCMSRTNNSANMAAAMSPKHGRKGDEK